jgi:hypothetical protein
MINHNFRYFSIKTFPVLNPTPKELKKIVQLKRQSFIDDFIDEQIQLLNDAILNKLELNYGKYTTTYKANPPSTLKYAEGEVLLKALDEEIKKKFGSEYDVICVIRSEGNRPVMYVAITEK